MCKTIKMTYYTLPTRDCTPSLGQFFRIWYLTKLPLESVTFSLISSCFLFASSAFFSSAFHAKKIYYTLMNANTHLLLYGARIVIQNNRVFYYTIYCGANNFHYALKIVSFASPLPPGIFSTSPSYQEGIDL